jgi:hypothetical protein
MSHPFHKTTVADAEKMHREDLIAWLVWNDPNGCYRDEDCDFEGFDRLTLGGALELVIEAIRESEPEVAR